VAWLPAGPPYGRLEPAARGRRASARSPPATARRLYLRAAENAEHRSRTLSAYRYAQAAFVGDQRALEIVDRLGDDWPGDGEQLVAVVREALRAADDA
jgi:hypothetical protein